MYDPSNWAVPESMEVIRERFLAAQSSGRIVLLDPLPRKVRFRLWRHSRIDKAATWLAYHNRPYLAEALWRIFRMW